MRSCPIQERDFQLNPATRQLLPNQFRNFSRPGRHFQQREVFRAGNLGHAFYHFLCGGNPAKPSVDPPKIPERILDVGRRTGVRIENLGSIDSLHGKEIAHELICLRRWARRAAVRLHVVRVPTEVAFEPVFNMRGRLEPVVLAGIHH